MTGREALSVVFSASEIHSRVCELAGHIATQQQPPDFALSILVGGFVFAADLLRALDERGISLQVEFVRLRSYGNTRPSKSGVRVLMGADDSVRGRHILLIDGVLDRGHTLSAARDLAMAAGARTVTTAVVIDNRRPDALLTADFAAFTDITAFVVGYGMDDSGRFRSLPPIAVVKA